MRSRTCALLAGAAATYCALTILPARAAAASPAAVDAARIEAADREPGNWMSYGRTYSEQRFSPLAQIDAGNARRLGLAWSFPLDTAHRGQESTPLVVDGVMYVTGAWSQVYALDARTGALKWRFDPKVPGRVAVNACCDVVNRGVAAWQGRIYVGTLDGRLIALDAATGRPLWQVMTVPPRGRYTITGAPRIVKDMVLIGNGGGEMGIRGYVTAYDARTGKQRWRFYTVPAAGPKPFAAAALAKAGRTWSGSWLKYGAGGPVWDSIVYDPALNRVYIGVGNGTPWSHARGEKAGDRWFLSSIVALNADTGAYVWHYQETPGDEWDFDACSPLMLADLKIGGAMRSVIMQAPKNGIFYVLDRRTGKLLAADAYADINWAKGVDLATGRPKIVPAARYGESGKPFIAVPGPGGAHSWQPTAYSPLTGLVYIPVMVASFPMIPQAHFAYRKIGWNTGVDFNAGSLPQDPAVKAKILQSLKGYLEAWDPVARKVAWRVELAHPWNGGTLATAGNLVFQGNADGQLVAYRADTGARLWSAETQAGVLAAPISYSVDGQQYVAVEVGWGGAFGLAAGELALKSHVAANVPRILAFRLGGTATLPALPRSPAPVLDPPPSDASATTIAQGKALYHGYCSSCHGDSATSSGVLPDLRYSALLRVPSLWYATVLDGVRTDRGMVGFEGALSKADADAIRAYVIDRAHQDAAAGR